MVVLFDNNMYETLGYYFSCGQLTYNNEYKIYFGQLICEMCEMRECGTMFYTEFAKKYEIPEYVAELMYYYLSERDDLWEYGSSPRGMWPTTKGIQLYNEIKAEMYKELGEVL